MKKGLVLLLAAVLLGVLVGREGETQEADRVPSVPENVSEVLRRQSEARTRAAVGAIQKAHLEAQARGESPVVGTMKEAFARMAGTRRSLYREEERKAILRELLGDSRTVETASRLLLDTQWNAKQFGEGQAASRLYAVSLLRERAAEGDLLPLETTIRQLAGQLSQVPHPSVGRRRDLEDLIAAYLYVRRETALGELDEVVRTLGYAPPLKKEFIAGIYFGLQETHERDVIVRRLNEVGIPTGGKTP